MTARFNVTDDLNLFLGGRVVDYRVTGLNPTIRESGRFIPYVGAVYDLNDTYSVYASYTDIFMPQDSWYRDSSNKLLEPDEGQNYEIGIKGEYLDGRLNTSLAYFEIHEENRAEEDALYNSKPTNPPSPTPTRASRPRPRATRRKSRVNWRQAGRFRLAIPTRSFATTVARRFPPGSLRTS